MLSNIVLGGEGSGGRGGGGESNVFFQTSELKHR